MSTSITYYIDAPSLLAATSIYSTPSLTFLAPDGFYSDGIISREQVGGVLLPPQTCPACGVPCSETKSNMPVSGKGVFTISVEVDAGTGVIPILLTGMTKGVGIIASMGAVVKNSVYSTIYGYISSPPGSPTYVGIDGPCPVAGTYPLTVYRYNDITSAWEDSGSSSVASPTAANIQTTPLDPGQCWIPFPKPSATTDIVIISFYAICKDTEFEIAIGCPESLIPVVSTVVAESSAEACELAFTEDYYMFGIVGGVSIQVNDVIFTDQNGQFPLAAGYYGIGGEYMQIDANGVVIEVSSC
jgi:hypothetical protein